MGKGLRKRKKLIEQKNAETKNKDILIDQLLEKANRYFFLHYARKKVVLELPDTSPEFWDALEDKIYRERLGYQVRRVWYSKKRVKVCCMDPFFYGYF